MMKLCTKRNILLLAITLLFVGAGVVFFAVETPEKNVLLDVSLPLEHSLVTGKQTFRLSLGDAGDLSPYRVLWSVDGGIRSGVMGQSGGYFIDTVEIDEWNWRKDNRYLITFEVMRDGEVLGVQNRVVYTVDTSVFAERYEEQEKQRLLEKDSLVYPISSKSFSPNTDIFEPTVAGATDERIIQMEIDWITSDRKDWVTQDFVLRIENASPEEYRAFWSAEGGHRNEITKHDKNGNPIVSINFSGWWWKGIGPYAVEIVLQDNQGKDVVIEAFDFKRGDNGLVVLEGLETFFVINEEPPAAASPVVVNNDVPKVGTPLLFEAGSWRLPTLVGGKKPAIEADLVAAINEGNQEAVLALSYILDKPQSTWLNGNDYDFVLMDEMFEISRSENGTPAFVLYNIPQRDCSMYSAGGAQDYTAYKNWIDDIVGAISWDAVFVVEPDALAMLNCLSLEGREARLDAMNYAVTELSKIDNVYVYVDAGHAFWVNPDEMASRLSAVNIQSARGFALNTSNYVTTQESILYGDRLARILGGTRYVIDSSRNANGRHSEYEWCNPFGRGLGTPPILHFGVYLDAELWIKTPGESDGYCNGGPRAGLWWRDYAIDLYKKRTAN